MMNRRKARHELAKDAILILLGAFITAILAGTGILDRILALIGGQALGSFISGIFFTSAFTIAPASVALARVGETAPVHVVALYGALGAMCGDLVLFFFVRDRFTADLEASIKPSFLKHVLSSFHYGFLKWLAPVIGALIIASPLPDELGVGLMGLSKTRAIALAPVSFVMNALGIYGLIWFAHLV